MSDTMDKALATIKAQQQADQVYELIRGNQQHPDFLLRALLEAECLPSFCRQISKRIAKEQA